MKLKLKKSIALIMVSLCMVAQISADDDDEKRSTENTTVEKYAFTSGNTLDLDLKIGGKVTITGWDKDEIEIAYIKRGSHTEAISIKTQELPTGIKVVTRSTERKSNHNLDIEVKLPRKSSHVLNSNGGDVSITDISGSISGSTMGGGIFLSNTQGTVNFETMGGNFLLEKCMLNGSVKTMGGDMRLNSVLGSLEVVTMGGRITYDGLSPELNDSTAPYLGDVSLQTMGGNILIKNVYQNLSAETMGGDIKVNRARNSINVTTMGGDISIEESNSSVIASTMGGNISASVVALDNPAAKEIALESSGGRVTLAVPKGFPMKIDMTLNVSKRGDDDNQIKCDLPLTRTEEKGTVSNGLKKKLLAKGVTGTGDNLVTMVTTNGSLTLIER